MRSQVRPYHPFGGDTSWITQEIIEGYIYAWLKGDQFAMMYLAKWSQGDEMKMKVFRESVFDDADYEDLKAEIWDECGMPEMGSIEYHIWQIERHLESPLTPRTELAKLYKILGEFRGWLVKPGEKSVTVNNVISGGNDPKRDFQAMNDKDAELTYASWVAGR